MRSTLDPHWPTWLRDVDALLAVHPNFVLSGNVRDRYLLPSDADPGKDPVTEEQREPWRVVDSMSYAIQTMLGHSGFDTVLVHDLVDGYRVLQIDGDDDAGWAAVHAATGMNNFASARGDDIPTLINVIRGLGSGTSRRLALVLDYASRLVINPASLSEREHTFFTACLKASHDAVPPAITAGERVGLHNPVFWLIEREHDLPAWFTAGNRAVRAVPVPWPDLKERETVARLLMPQDGANEVATEVAGRTQGFSVDGIFDVAALTRDQQIAPADAGDAVRLYTVGAGESPWRHGVVAERLREIDQESTDLGRRVLGQERAVTKAIDILKRAVVGLSGAQSGSSFRPRGVLFFAGPTGSGKTELAKAITELVFGSDQACVRFDMSEFSSEHAGERLVGAPPGYIGFEGGGELTNAVRRQPYSLLLFDEVEKAHPRILDKFLQLLDDGRLTDGRGTTVHFSETIIVFTSNLGMTKPAADGSDRRVPVVTPDDPYEKIEPAVKKEIKRHFTEELNRPELLNRVGDNIVVFDYIRTGVAREITDLQLENIAKRVLEAVGVTVDIEPALDSLYKITTSDLSYGGRGIGNVLESRFVNPLARELFDRDVPDGEQIKVAAVREAGEPGIELR